MDKCDIGQEILESIRAIKRGECKCYTMELPDPKVICERKYGINSSETIREQNVICPMCEEGQLMPNICTEQSIYKGKTFGVEYESSSCSICGSEIVTPTQAHRNQARILDEQRKINGLLTRCEIKHLLP